MTFIAGCFVDVSRSREGAWIEIDVVLNAATAKNVAPARERGLKSTFRGLCHPLP